MPRATSGTNTKTAARSRLATGDPTRVPQQYYPPPLPPGPGGAPSTPYLDDTANTWKGALQGIGLGAGAIGGTIAGGPLGGYAGAKLGYTLGGAAGSGIDDSDANYKVAAEHPDWVLGADGMLHPRVNVAPGGAGNAGMQPGTASAASPLTSAPAGSAPSFAGINQQTSDITAGLRAQYAADQADRAAPLAGATPPAQASLATVPGLPRVADIGAAQAPGSQLQRVGNITAANAAPTTLARVDPITGATIDQGASDQTRGQQETSLAGLRAAATGAVPSAAELQLRQTTDRNVKNQYALAAALQGRSAGGALKQASDATGDLNAQAAADAAVLRANEQAAARTAESNALSGVRGQDIGVATSQAGLTQGAQVQNQNTGVQQNTTAANLEANNKQFNAGLKQAADITNQGAGITQNATQFGADTDLSKYNAGLRQATAVQNQNVGVTQNATQFNAATEISKLNATLGTDVSKFTASQVQALSLANQDAQLRQRGLDDQRRSVILTAMMQAQGLGLQGVSAAAVAQNMQAAQQLAREQLAASTSQADRAYWTNVIASTLQAGAAGYSLLNQAGKVPSVNLGGNSTVNGEQLPVGSSSYPGETNGTSGAGDYGADDYGNNGVPDGQT